MKQQKLKIFELHLLGGKKWNVNFVEITQK